MNQGNRVVEPLLNIKSSLLGEGPVWDSEKQSIFWIDISQGKIYEYNIDNQQYRSIDVGQMVGAIALCKDDKWVAALQKGIAYISCATGKVEMIISPELCLPNNRFNDGKCDPAGRFWAGTMSMSEEPQMGSLYVLSSNLSIRKKLTGISISNGLAWSLDNKKLYYIDTPTLEVCAFDYDLESGDIQNQQSIIKISEEDGYPDGMTIDAEGMLWIAHWNGWQVTRWNPVTGQKIDSIHLPVARVTSCTFGGKNLDDLYITTAKVGLSATELAQQPLAGSLFVVKNCGVRGIEASRFRT